MSQQAKQSWGLQQNLDSRSLLGDSGVKPSFPVCDERQQNLEMFRQSSPHIIRVAALHIVSRLVLPANNTFSIKHQGRWHGQARQAGGAYRTGIMNLAPGICARIRSTCSICFGVFSIKICLPAASASPTQSRYLLIDPMPKGLRGGIKIAVSLGGT